jgi:hypothetical protein
MVSRQPWLSADDVRIPVEVTFRARPEPATVFGPTELPRPRPRPRPTPRADRPRPRPRPRNPVAG